MTGEIYKVLSLPATTIEAALNALGDDWSPQVWNIAEVNGQIMVTVIFVSARYLRQAAMMAGNMASRIGRPGS